MHPTDYDVHVHVFHDLCNDLEISMEYEDMVKLLSAPTACGVRRVYFWGNKLRQIALCHHSP